MAEFKEQWELDKLPKEFTPKKCLKKPVEIEVLRFNLAKMMNECYFEYNKTSVCIACI